jgi:hypothetical protein
MTPVSLESALLDESAPINTLPVADISAGHISRKAAEI